MANPFQKAKREQIWTKVLLAGPSGSGKTYSALRLAKGIANKCDSRIAAIDTEQGRIRYYASEFDFDDMQLDDFKPESYATAIGAAVAAGYKVLIIDSISHEWNYCVDTVNKMPGNSFTNWGKVTPRHDKFMETMLQSPIHIICTVRGKDEYILEEKNGKQVPKKVGLGFKQRDGVEYEYTLTFNLEQDTHIASSTKDNTHLFEGRYEMLTEKDGEALYDWANSGEAPARNPVAKPTTAVAHDSAEDVRAKIAEQVTKLINDGVAKEDIGQSINAVADTANYNKIGDARVLGDVLNALKKMEG